MAQRVSGFERVPADLYQTPGMFVDDLLSVVRIAGPVLEPACGIGKICSALATRGLRTVGTDVNDYGTHWQVAQVDFLTTGDTRGCRSIVTNPPYGVQGRLAVKFIEHALMLTKAVNGQVWMLLPSDFDHGITRRHLFDEHPAFCARVVLHNRIKWFEDPTKRSDPSQNHAWFGWDWLNRGGRQIYYAGKSKKERAA